MNAPKPEKVSVRDYSLGCYQIQTRTSVLSLLLLLFVYEVDFQKQKISSCNEFF